MCAKQQEAKQASEDTLPEVIEEQTDKDLAVSTRQEDFTDFLSPYSKDEPKDSINAVSTLQDVIDFTSPDFDKSENMDYSLPHLGDEPNNGFAVSRQENFTDFLSPQVSVEPEARNLAGSTCQEHLPNISLSHSRAKPNKDVSVASRQDDLTDLLSLDVKPEAKNLAVSSRQEHLPNISLSDSRAKPNKDVSASTRQDNFTDLLSLNVEPKAKNLAVSSRQGHLPNISSSPSRAKPNKGLSASTRQDNFTAFLLNVEPKDKNFAVSTHQQDFTQQPTPRFKQFLTDDTHSISSHQPSPPNVIPNSDTDQPPKYVSQRIRPIRRRQIPNYPHSTAPLPADIASEEIITSYPNHLHGQTLLNLLETWTPSEIAETCPAKEINKGMISTRVKYARQRLVPDYQPRRRMMAAGVEKAERKTKKGKGKGKGGKEKEAAIEAALEEAESGVASVGSAQVVAKESGSSGIAQPVNGYRRVNYRNPFDD